MAILPIVIEPDPRLSQLSPRLRQVSEPVDEITDDIRELAADMFETMKDADGVGLAAPQVGVLKRLVVIHIPEDHEEEGSPEQRLTLINPQIVKAGGRETLIEGCLSFPELAGEVERYSWVIVKATDIDGSSMRFRARGLLARAVQHEIDHLDGVLFFDRMDNIADLFYLDDLAEEEVAAEESGSVTA